MSAVAPKRKIAAESPRDDPEINLDQDAPKGDFGDEESPGCIGKILEKPWLLITIGVATLVALFILLWACGVFSFTEKKPDASPGSRRDATSAHKNTSNRPPTGVDTTNVSANNQDQSLLGSLGKKWSELPIWKYAVCAIPLCLIGYNMTRKPVTATLSTNTGATSEELDKISLARDTFNLELTKCDTVTKCRQQVYNDHCKQDNAILQGDRVCTDLHSTFREADDEDPSTTSSTPLKGIKEGTEDLKTFWGPVFEDYVKPGAILCTAAYVITKLSSFFCPGYQRSFTKEDVMFGGAHVVFSTRIKGKKCSVIIKHGKKLKMREVSKNKWEEKSKEELIQLGLTKFIPAFRKGQTVYCREKLNSKPIKATIMERMAFVKDGKREKYMKVKTKLKKSEMFVPKVTVQDVKSAWRVNEYVFDSSAAGGLADDKSLLRASNPQKDSYTLEDWEKQGSSISGKIRTVYTSHEKDYDGKVFTTEVIKTLDKNSDCDFKSIRETCDINKCKGCILLYVHDAKSKKRKLVWSRVKFQTKNDFNAFWRAHGKTDQLSKKEIENIHNVFKPTKSTGNEDDLSETLPDEDSRGQSNVNWDYEPERPAISLEKTTPEKADSIRDDAAASQVPQRTVYRPRFTRTGEPGNYKWKAF